MNHPGRSLVLLFLFLLAATAVQARQKTYRIGYILSTRSQLGAAGKAFADEVARRTGGKIKIEQQPNAALVGEVEMLNGLELGTVDFAFITGAALPNIIPEVGVFNIPFHILVEQIVGSSPLHR